MLGFSRDEIGSGLDEWSKRVHPDDLARVMADVQAHLDGTTPLYTNEHRVSCKDGSYKWILDRGLVVERDTACKPVRVIGTHSDISERKRIEAATRESSQYARRLIETSLDPLITISAAGKITDVNSAMEEVTGVSRDSLIGTDFINYFTESGKAREGYQEVFSRGTVRDYPLTIRHVSGKVTEVLYNASVYRDTQGNVIGVFAAARDITERKIMEEKVRQLAFHDPLTNLPNRRLLADRLMQAMGANKRSGCYGAVLFLDLDNFKPLNDAHGHDFGDLLLIEVAERLKACVREADTVARFGGDEFVVMIGELLADKDGSRAQAMSVAEKIRSTLSQPYQLNIKHDGVVDTAVTHYCTASIGVALFINHEASSDDVLKWADAAMYRAKDAGRNVIRFHE